MRVSKSSSEAGAEDSDWSDESEGGGSDSVARTVKERKGLGLWMRVLREEEEEEGKC